MGQSKSKVDLPKDTDPVPGAGDQADHDRLIDLVNPPKKFSFQEQWYWGRCFRVVDGDTFELAIIFHGDEVLFKCRAIGYNTAEISKAKTAEERKKGIDAKEHVQRLIENSMVWVKFVSLDSFGRPLVDVKFALLDADGKTVRYQYLREHLIDVGLAKKYTGRGKKAW